MGIKPTPFTPYHLKLGKYPFMVTVVPYIEPKMPWALDYGFYAIMACVVAGVLVAYFA